MSAVDIAAVPASFAEAAERAIASGFRWIEIHAAHGYLFNEFLSPISNTRRDEYGGRLENRARLLLETAREIRSAIGAGVPLAVRLSASDWVENGWGLEATVALAVLLGGAGVDLIHCSSGGNVRDAHIPVGAGYQVPFAERVRQDAGVLSAAVGLITDPTQADEQIRNGRADIVMIGRAMLRDPYWAIRAAPEVRKQQQVPNQYSRAFGDKASLRLRG